jgi:ABC-type lipoprotein release transport system permease subunit
MLQSHNVYTTTLKERNQSYFNVVQIQPRLFFIVRYEVLIAVFMRIYVICNVMLCYWINSSQCSKEHSAFYLHGVL